MHRKTVFWLTLAILISFLGSLAPQIQAMTVNSAIELVKRRNLYEGTGWEDIDLAGLGLYEAGITAVYLEIYLEADGLNCDEPLRIEIQPKEGGTIRTLYCNNMVDGYQFGTYVWLPVTARQTLQYRIKNFCYWDLIIREFKISLMGRDS